MTVPSEAPLEAFSPILLPAERLPTWLREARLLPENPFVEDGERLFIGASDRALGEWCAEMAEVRK